MPAGTRPIPDKRSARAPSWRAGPGPAHDRAPAAGRPTADRRADKTRIGCPTRRERGPDGTGRCRRPGGTEGQGGPGRPHLARLGPGLAPTSPARMRAAPRAPAAMPTDAAVHDRARSSAGPSAGPTEPADRRHHSLRRCRAAARAAAGAYRLMRLAAPRKAFKATAVTAQADPDGRTRRARLGRRPWPARAAPRRAGAPRAGEKTAAAAAASGGGGGKQRPQRRGKRRRRPQGRHSGHCTWDRTRPARMGSGARMVLRRLMMVRDGGVAWHPCASRLDAAAHAHGCAARLFGIVAIGTTLAPADSIYFT